MGLLPRIEVDGIDVDMPPINITALNDLVSLVHIPISCLTDESETHSSRIYWTIERANKESEEFFNVTSNRIDIAIFASKELVSEEWTAVSETDTSVRLSEGWRVFEIDSGDIGDELNSGNYDSPHLRHVSAPLAKEGISILYQSSYHADFLMVTETDFERASEIFMEHGWTINPTSNPSPRQSLSPYSSVPTTPMNPRTPATPISPSSPLPPSPNQPSPPLTTASSHSSAHELTALPSPLAVIGFHRSSSLFQLHTGLIQKYITWPSRCRAQYATPHGQSYYVESQTIAAQDDRPFISYTRTQDGASLITEVRVIRGMFKGLEEGMLCGEEIGEGWESEAESDLEVEDTDRSGSETERGSDTEVDEPIKPATAGSVQVRPGQDHRSDNNEDDDDDDDTPRASLAGGQTMTPPPEYFPQPFRRDKRHSPRPGNQHRKTQTVPVTPDIPGLAAAFDFQSRGPRMSKRRSTVGVRLGGLGKRAEKGERRKGRKRCIQLDMSRVGEVEDGREAYHLDKSGLVTRFSTLLQKANIRMLYSSTFHTANILVEAKDVRTARRLLEGVK